MKLNKFIYITLCITALVFVGCSSSGGDDDTPPPPTGGGDDDPVVIPDPAAATLVFPEDETECTTGTVDPNDDTMSTITFQWNASANTDRYTVTVTNLNTDSASFTNVNTNEAEITLERGVPYSWFVTSRANGTTTTTDSAPFRFYNEGAGVENYAPFPAQAVSPARGANLDAAAAVSFEWSGSDIDNDITGYEVFLGTDASALATAGTATEMTLADVAVASGSTYFWQVVTTDSAGNTSTSEIFEFRVN